MKSGIVLVLWAAAAVATGCGDAAESEILETSMALAAATPAFDPSAVTAGEGESHYAGPAGKADGEGTAKNPWSLARALEHPPEVQPGDTIWLLEGVYKGCFLSRLAGQPDKPIIVRSFPGHRVVIDSGTESAAPALSIDGPDTWFWGLEVSSTNPNRAAPDPRNPEKIDRATGVYMRGERSRLINSVVHDVARGVVMVPEAVNAEAYGNLIYYCGWAGVKRGYGTAVTVRNGQGAKFVEENIQFGGFENGIQCMGDQVRDVTLRGNVSFNSGVLFQNQRTVNLLISAAGSGASGMLLDANHSYFPLNGAGGTSALGWVYGGDEESIRATGNYWVGGMTPVELWNWKSVEFTGNVLAAAPGRVQLALTSPKAPVTGYLWDRNQYYGSKFLRLDGAKIEFDDWKAKSGHDQTGEWKGDIPSGLWSVVRANRYEPGRGHVVLYNWDKAASVELDLSEALTKGSDYELRDAQNFHGDPVAKGCYQGGKVKVNLPAAPHAARPVGVDAAPEHSGPVFWTLIAVSKPGCSDGAMSASR